MEIYNMLPHLLSNTCRLRAALRDIETYPAFSLYYLNQKVAFVWRSLDPRIPIQPSSRHPGPLTPLFPIPISCAACPMSPHSQLHMAHTWAVPPTIDARELPAPQEPAPCMCLFFTQAWSPHHHIWMITIHSHLTLKQRGDTNILFLCLCVCVFDHIKICWRGLCIVFFSIFPPILFDFARKFFGLRTQIFSETL